MSKGVFTVLDSYVGKQETFLTASEALTKRLKKIRDERLDNSDWMSPDDTMPTIADVLMSHALYIKKTYKPFVAFGHEYYKTSPENGTSITLPSDGSTVEVRFNLRSNNGDFIHDQVVKIVLESKGRPDAPASSQRYRYCDFPGIRLLREVRLVVDKDTIDTYTTEDILFHMRNHLDTDAQAAFGHLVGQQEIHDGVYYHHDINVEQVMQFTEGAQTFKPYQPELELWIPLIFDHNSDVGRSLHNKLIGSQQVYVELVFNGAPSIIQLADNTNTVLSNQPQSLAIREITLYTKNIYLNPEINDLFTVKKTLSLIRVHRRHNVALTNPTNILPLTSLKYPIEVIKFGCRPNINADVVGNPQHNFTDWHQMAVVSRKSAAIPAFIPSQHGGPYKQIVVRTAIYARYLPTMNSIGLKLFGNEIWPVVTGKFFERYQSYTTPGFHPSGYNGYYSASFSLYPTEFSPSGHINNSTAREFYIQYNSNNISTLSPATLFISAQAVNFVWYTDNGIKLKYIV